MAKTKITMFLDSDLIKWLDMNRDEETSRSALVRILIRKAMKEKSRKKTNTLVDADPFSGSTITADSIPDDLKDYADLLIEWWPIRKKKVDLVLRALLTASLIHLGHFHHKIEKKLLKRQLQVAGRIYIHLRRVTNQKNQKIIIQHQEYLQQKEVLNNGKNI